MNSEILNLIFKHTRDGVVVVGKNGQFLFWNAAANGILDLMPMPDSPQVWPEKFGLYKSDKSKLLNYNELPAIRALKGEHIKDFSIWVENKQTRAGKMVIVSAIPLEDNGEIQGSLVFWSEVPPPLVIEEPEEVEKHLFTLKAITNDVNERLKSYA